MRTMLSPFFTFSKLKTMLNLIMEYIVNYMDTLPVRSKEENENENYKDVFTKLSADSIVSSAFGIKVDSMNDPENKVYIVGR